MSFRIFLKYKYTQKYKDFTGLSKIIIFADPDGTTFCGMKHGNVKIEKTNAARLLDRAKIAYELIPYRVDEEHLAATHVAEQLGEDVAAVFKTLVLRGDRTGHFVCVVPGDHEVDLKAAARISGNKKADLIPVRELLPTTGYIRGGCSPIGMKNRSRPFSIFPFCNTPSFMSVREFGDCRSGSLRRICFARRGRNGRNQPSVVCGGGIRSVILFCYSIPFSRSAELSCCRSDRRTGISETIRYFSLGAGLVSPLSAGREMPYRTARIRMRITEQAAMNCVGAAGRSRYIQR